MLVNARLAADAAGATKMDRPEWTAVNPANGEIYITMTENPDRGNVGSSRRSTPRIRATGSTTISTQTRRGTSKGNVNGHIVRLRETGNDAAATSSTGTSSCSAPGADARTPDERQPLGPHATQRPVQARRLLVRGRRGILWIETDDNTYTDVTNCMLLAAMPGEVGDGGTSTSSTNTDAAVRRA